MKLIRFGAPARERPGVILPDGRRIDASGFAGESADYDEAFVAAEGLERLAQGVVQEGRGAPVVPDGVRLGPPLSRPSKIVCVGLNYRDHARESGMAVPDEPVLFFKATSAITGPNDDVIIPKNGTKVDWEVELAVVIGRRAAYVERDKAGEHIVLREKTAVVTGASTGIGRASALRFAQEGARVVLADIQDAEGAAVASAIVQTGGTACSSRPRPPS